MNSDPNCIFCQIASKKKPEEILYEDDRVLCFLDRFRQSSVGGHALVIPRAHYENIWSLPSDLCAPLMQVAHLTAKASKEVIPCSGIRLWIANGKSAGQEIFHLHVHVFPCKSVMDRIKYLNPTGFVFHAPFSFSSTCQAKFRFKENSTVLWSGLDCSGLVGPLPTRPPSVRPVGAVWSLGLGLSRSRP